MYIDFYLCFVPKQHRRSQANNYIMLLTHIALLQFPLVCVTCTCESLEKSHHPVS